MTQMMRIPDDSEHAFFLTRSVARSMGLCLSDALRTGALTAVAYGRMVESCRACGQVGVCEEWLSSRTSLSSDATPGCRNATALKALRAAQ